MARKNVEQSVGALEQVEDKCKWKLWSGGAHTKVSYEQTRRGEGESQEDARVKSTLGKE